MWCFLRCFVQWLRTAFCYFCDYAHFKISLGTDFFQYHSFCVAKTVFMPYDCLKLLWASNPMNLSPSVVLFCRVAPDLIQLTLSSWSAELLRLILAVCAVKLSCARTCRVSASLGFLPLGSPVRGGILRSWRSLGFLSELVCLHSVCLLWRCVKEAGSCFREVLCDTSESILAAFQLCSAFPDAELLFAL